MSMTVQKPEHRVIRDYVTGLRDQKAITLEGLRDAFVPVYLEMIPPDDDVPRFERVHRHDSVEQARRKDQANLKKLWRAIDGTTFFPLTFKAPLIVALDSIKPGLGTELQKLLLHNAGLYHLPIEMSEHAPSVYAEWLQEFSEANTAMVADVNGNGRLDSPMTYKEVLDVIEKSLQVIRELEKNTEQQTAH